MSETTANDKITSLQLGILCSGQQNIANTYLKANMLQIMCHFGGGFSTELEKAFCSILPASATPAELVVWAGHGAICCWEMNRCHPSLVSNNSIFAVYSEEKQLKRVLGLKQQYGKAKCLFKDTQSSKNGLVWDF